MKIGFIIAAMGITTCLTTGCGTFHGRVVDQNNEPVPKAEVCVSHTTPSLGGCLFPFVPDWFSVVHHTWKTTRSDGTFRVVGLYGYNWSISGAHGARKTGYEYQYPVEYDSKNHFYLIRMRKRLNPCFLHHEPYTEYGFKIPKRTLAVDFIQKEGVQIDPPKVRANSSWPLPTLIYDVLIDAQFDSTAKTWSVTFRSSSDNGGILATTNRVYEAPADGYSDRLSFSIPVSRQAVLGPKCLVIRSRNPQIFTRLDVTHVMAKEDYLGLSFDRYTNPYGDRALDIDPRTDQEYFIRKKLIEDSQKAWQEGHPPAKPDFSDLLKEVNEFRER